MSVVTLSRDADSGVSRLTLNRAEKANALNDAMVDALLDALTAVQQDGTRLLVIDAAGRHFCAGFDLSDLDDVSDGDLVLRFVRIETLLQTLYHLPIPTLALAKGRAMGAGADLFCACNQRIAAPETKFRMPGLAFCIVLGTRRLVARIGPDAARRIQAEIQTFDATAAHHLGFATDIVPEAEWSMHIETATAAAGTLDIAATNALFRVTAEDTRAQDMADLVASASRPGLKVRIQAYRDLITR